MNNEVSIDYDTDGSYESDLSDDGIRSTKSIINEFEYEYFRFEYEEGVDDWETFKNIWLQFMYLEIQDESTQGLILKAKKALHNLKRCDMTVTPLNRSENGKKLKRRYI